MEREMKTFKDEERRLAQAAKKDNMRRQLEAQRQKVQNLRGMTPVFVWFKRIYFKFVIYVYIQ